MSSKTVEKSVLIWYSAQQMFDLVRDVPSYPEFLPWCSKASIVQQHEDGVTAEVEMSLKGFKQSFATRNVYQIPHSLQMQLVKGPFSELAGLWQFTDLQSSFDDAQAQNACKVQFKLQYAFSSATLSTLIGPMFDKIAASMVDAFMVRAEKVYG